MKHLISKEGFEKLKAEWEHLKYEERPAMINQVQAAAAEGDRSENAAYTYGRMRVREIDRRLRELDRILDGAKIVENVAPEDGSIKFGATIKMLDIKNKREKTYSIVGEKEIDPLKGRISMKSPIGGLPITIKSTLWQGNREISIERIGSTKLGHRLVSLKELDVLPWQDRRLIEMQIRQAEPGNAPIKIKRQFFIEGDSVPIDTFIVASDNYYLACEQGNHCVDSRELGFFTKERILGRYIKQPDIVKQFVLKKAQEFQKTFFPIKKKEIAEDAPQETPKEEPKKNKSDVEIIKVEIGENGKPQQTQDIKTNNGPERVQQIKRPHAIKAIDPIKEPTKGQKK